MSVNTVWEEKRYNNSLDKRKEARVGAVASRPLSAVQVLLLTSPERGWLRIRKPLQASKLKGVEGQQLSLHRHCIMSKGCLRENQIRRHVSPVSENPQLAVKAAGRFSRMECSCVSIQLDVPPEMKPGPGTHSISCFQHSGGGIALGPEEMLSYPAGNGKHNTADVIQEVPRESL